MKRREVVLWLEEAASYGKLDSLINAYSTARAYGVHVVSIWTDNSRLHEIYGEEANSLIGNSAFQVWIPGKEVNTAEHVSKVSGFRDVVTYSKSLNWNPNQGAAGSSINSSASQIRREVMTVSEAMDLPAGEAIVIVRGVPGLIRSRLIPFFKQKRFEGLFGTSSFYR
jgi:type IV secretory pathway TraG/TraD family ATPase VirD4